MDERNIPDPKNSYKWANRQTRGAKGLVKDFVLKRLLEGRLTDKEIAEECAILYGGSTSAKAVQWYKFQFRQAGLLEKSAHKRQKRRYLTEFKYELIFLQVDPPDNVEVISAKQLIDFAKSIVVRYARLLPKPIDEIVYDVRTAKYYLEKTKKFQVIDQNDYANPFTFEDVESKDGDDSDGDDDGNTGVKAK